MYFGVFILSTVTRVKLNKRLQFIDKSKINILICVCISVSDKSKTIKYSLKLEKRIKKNIIIKIHDNHIKFSINFKSSFNFEKKISANNKATKR